MNHPSLSTRNLPATIHRAVSPPPRAILSAAPCLTLALLLLAGGPGAATLRAAANAAPAAVAPELVPNRTAPTFVPAPAEPEAVFSATPTHEEIGRVRAFEELLVPMSGPTASATENRVLATALAAYQQARLKAGPSNAADADLSTFESFVARHPQSAWNASLLTNLGVEYYHRGAFSQALAAWQHAWQLGQRETSPAAAAVIDRALGELTRMLARLGRVEELQTLMTATADRKVSGLGAEAYNGARGGLWNMLNHPEESFKCGPWALDSILTQANPAHPYRLKLKQVASTKQGVSLSEVAALAKDTGLTLVPMRRESATGLVPVPAVVHWKLGHYGALLRYENGRYLLQDPTFGNSQWITQATLDQEASGSFLVTPSAQAKQGEKSLLAASVGANWKPIDAAEAKNIYGKGFPSGYPPPPPPPPPDDPPGDGPPCGMAAWSFRLSELDLTMDDTPLYYAPPVGPAIRFHVSYEQRDANQPATLSFANLGNKWNFEWITTLTFDSNNAYVNSGQSGVDTFAGYTSASASSGLSDITRTKIVKSGANYQLVSPDSSMVVFGVHDGAGRYYMTRKTDAQGNSVNLAYDSQYRLITITDAIGQVSTLTYGNASDPLKITKITDPFGRTALFAYDANLHLSQITDAIGLTSQFTYVSGSDFIQTLTTGYGATTFTSTENGLDRTLLVTLPNGGQEMAQSLGGTTNGVAYSDPAALLPQGVPEFNAYLYVRNTSYWDRKAMLEAPGDPTRARIYHFLHGNNLQKSTILESVKLPFENRVWYYYQGQQQPGFVNTDGQGMLNRPTRIGRVLDDGTTQLYQCAYNPLGYMTQNIDPAGRTTNYVYDANGIDLLQVRQTTGINSTDLLSANTYNAHHQPLTVTGSNGQQAKFAYNSLGQPLTITDPKGQVTTYVYGANNYLQSVTGPLAGQTGQSSLTYDAYGRLRTATDALGYVQTFAYDNLNRLLNVTFPDGTKFQRTYTLLDTTTITDRLNRVTNYTFDSIRELTAVTDPLNQTTKFNYCRCGALNALTDPLGRMTTLDYDVRGRPTARHYPDGSTATYAYEATTSRLRSLTDGKGQTTTYRYNNDNTLALIAYPTALKATPSVRFTYDPNYLRFASMIDGTGATTYTYNPVASPGTLGAGALATMQNPFGTVSYGYDELGRMTSRTVDGVPESYTYNSLGMITSESDALGISSFGYLGNTRLLSSISLPNGETSALSYFPNSGDHRLQQISHNRPGGAALSQWTYGYNAVGDITGWTQQRDGGAARAFTLGYDADDALTSAAVTNPTASYGYTYDPATNRLSETVNGSTTSAVYNSLNELGNVTPPPATDRTYEWDGADRLVAINYTGTANRSEFTYDGRGRRVQIVEKTGATVTATRRFLWDGAVMRVEKDGTGTVTKRFFKMGEQFLGGSAPGNYYFTYDHLGSVREMLDASGTLRARYDYDVYGRRTKLSGDLDADTGFAGYFYHSASGLGLTFARAYDANVGRWLSRDPIGESGNGPNLYAYVENNPVTFVDPLGYQGNYGSNMGSSGNYGSNIGSGGNAQSNMGLNNNAQSNMGLNNNAQSNMGLNGNWQSNIPGNQGGNVNGGGSVSGSGQMTPNPNPNPGYPPPNPQPPSDPNQPPGYHPLNPDDGGPPCYAPNNPYVPEPPAPNGYTPYYPPNGGPPTFCPTRGGGGGGGGGGSGSGGTGGGGGGTGGGTGGF